MGDRSTETEKHQDSREKLFERCQHSIFGEFWRQLPRKVAGRKVCSKDRGQGRFCQVSQAPLDPGSSARARPRSVFPILQAGASAESSKRVVFKSKGWTAPSRSPWKACLRRFRNKESNSRPRVPQVQAPSKGAEVNSVAPATETSSSKPTLCRLGEPTRRPLS